MNGWTIVMVICPSRRTGDRLRRLHSYFPGLPTPLASPLPHTTGRSTSRSVRPATGRIREEGCSRSNSVRAKTDHTETICAYNDSIKLYIPFLLPWSDGGNDFLLHSGRARSKRSPPRGTELPILQFPPPLAKMLLTPLKWAPPPSQTRGVRGYINEV